MPGSEAKSRFYGWMNFSGNISTSDAGGKTPERKFSADLRSTSQPDGIKPDRALHRTPAG